jgi:hypothetical protein
MSDIGNMQRSEYGLEGRLSVWGCERVLKAVRVYCSACLFLRRCHVHVVRFLDARSRQYDKMLH